MTTKLILITYMVAFPFLAHVVNQEYQRVLLLVVSIFIIGRLMDLISKQKAKQQ